MSESIFDFVLAELKAAKPQWEDISKATGVPLATIIKIGRGYTTNPRVKVVEELAAYFRSQPVSG